MLRNLFIRDFVIVKQAEIAFNNGFTVFSGETGAGKSILIDALALALGARTDTSFIKEGAKHTDISAVFEPPETLTPWLEEQAIEGPELILRRVIEQSGRSKAYINGIPATLSQIRSVSQKLVDIHGQHAHQSLLQASTQREILDAQAQILEQAAKLAKLWQQWQQAKKTLTNAQADAAVQQQKKVSLELDINYLEKINPQDNEWEELCAIQSRLAHGQALVSAAANAIQALDGETGAAITAINTATNTLGDVLRHDESLSVLTETLETARIACIETVSSLNSYIDKLELNPEQLQKTETRMSTLFEAARRLQTEPENLYKYLDKLQLQLEQLKLSTDLAYLQKQCDSYEQEYYTLASLLSKKRQTAAKQLSDKVSLSMQELAMPGGKFAVNVTPGKAGPHGNDDIEFLVAAHPGVKPRPLNKVASGGELARISLSISVIASLAARVPTLIFDEVDAGIGGAVAEVVGRLLQELGSRHQVLCVTHLPQVAAQASTHFQVKKTSSGAKTISEIKLLDTNQRIDELARMLGGLKITATTRSHAKEMLTNAQ